MQKSLVYDCETSHCTTYMYTQHAVSKENCYFTVLISPDILESKVVNLSQLNNILTIYLFNNMIRMLFD